MIRFTIKKPVWNTESVGIADKRVQGDTLMEVVISYRDKNKQKVYPYRYHMRTEKIREYPTQFWKGNTLHIVPIADFHAIE